MTQQPPINEEYMNYLKFMYQHAEALTPHIRLVIIATINRSWYEQIITFVMENMAFTKLLPIVASDEFPTGFNKNPNENTPPHIATKNIFEIIINGLAYAGSEIEYGKEQFSLMLNYFREKGELREDMDLPDEVQVEKIHVYRSLIYMMVKNNLKMDDLKYIPEHMELIEKVSGMTESTITLLHLLFGPTDSDKCIPYNYNQFKRGMCMFYGLQNPTKEELKSYVDKWSNKKVGFMFVVQYAHYSEYVEHNEEEEEEEDINLPRSPSPCCLSCSTFPPSAPSV
jgi:hypothetical protein